MAKTFTLREERGVTTVIDHAVDYFRMHFRPLVRVLVPIAGPAVLVLALIQAAGRIFIPQTGFMFDEGDFPFTSAYFLYIGAYGLVYLITYTLVLVGVLAYMRRDDESSSGEVAAGPVPAEVWDVARARLGPAVVGMIMYFGVFVAPVAVFSIGLGLMVMLADTGTTSLLGSGLTIAALFVAMMVWLFWLAGRLCVYLPAIVFEDVGVIEALGRSWQLTRGLFWRSLGVVVLVGLLIYMITMGLSLPVGVVEFVNEFMNVTLTVPLIALDSLVLIGSVLIQGGYWIAIGLYYFSLAEKRDATGLMHRIEALEEGFSSEAAPADDFPPGEPSDLNNPPLDQPGSDTSRHD